MLRRSWVEINLDVIENNFKIFEGISAGRELMAVVKADAYGHGDRAVTERLALIGCRNFAVSNIDEALAVRKAGAKGQILILGYTPAEAIPRLIENDITQTLLSEDFAAYFASEFQKPDFPCSPGQLKVQFAVDTGMNRIGLDADEPEACELAIRRYAAIFNMTGIFTHLCAADSPSEKDFTDEQIAKFRLIVNAVSDLKLPYVHCMNTAGSLFCQPFGNMIRLGISMYGLKPDYSIVLPVGIKPAMTWKSVISQIKTVRKGETVGYGRSFAAERDMVVATIPTGYADGYNRRLSSIADVIIRGCRARVVGRVCMDQMMVDISHIPDAAFEDEVILMGEDITADDLAQSIGTIGYELICAISKRVPRIYVFSEKSEKK